MRVNGIPLWRGEFGAAYVESGTWLCEIALNQASGFAIAAAAQRRGRGCLSEGPVRLAFIAAISGLSPQQTHFG